MKNLILLTLTATVFSAVTGYALLGEFTAVLAFATGACFLMGSYLQMYNHVTWRNSFQYFIGMPIPLFLIYILFLIIGVFIGVPYDQSLLPETNLNFRVIAIGILSGWFSSLIGWYGFVDHSTNNRSAAPPTNEN